MLVRKWIKRKGRNENEKIKSVFKLYMSVHLSKKSSMVSYKQSLALTFTIVATKKHGLFNNMYMLFKVLKASHNTISLPKGLGAPFLRAVNGARSMPMSSSRQIKPKNNNNKQLRHQSIIMDDVWGFSASLQFESTRLHPLPSPFPHLEAWKTGAFSQKC